MARIYTNEKSKSKDSTQRRKGHRGTQRKNIKEINKKLKHRD